MFTAGQKVQVVKDLEATPENGGGSWIGKLGTFVAYREQFAIVAFDEQQMPRDVKGEDPVSGEYEAWFSDEELLALPTNQEAFAVIDAYRNNKDLYQMQGIWVWVNSTKIKGVRQIQFTIRDIHDQAVVDKVMSEILALIGNLPHKIYTFNFWMYTHNFETGELLPKVRVKHNCVKLWYASDQTHKVRRKWFLPYGKKVKVMSGLFAGCVGKVESDLRQDDTLFVKFSETRFDEQAKLEAQKSGLHVWEDKFYERDWACVPLFDMVAL